MKKTATRFLLKSAHKLLFIAVFSLLSLVFEQAQAQNNALYFDGDDTYVAANSVSGALSGANDPISMEAWIKVESWSNETEYVLTFHSSDNDGDRRNVILFGVTKEGKLTITDNSGPTDNNYWGTSTIELNVWTHITLTIDSENNATCYINGKVEPMSTKDSPAVPLTKIIAQPESNGTFSIGQDWDNPSNITNDFIGEIDDVRIWKSERTQSEIQANMFRELEGNEVNLVAYYNMNAGSGDSLEDNSLNSNTGTVLGSPVWKTSGAVASVRNALDFDGVDDYVEIPPNPALQITGDLTVEAWAKYDDLGSDNKCQLLIHGGTGSESSAYNILYSLGIKSDKRLELFSEQGEGDNIVFTSSEPAPIDAGVWHHYAIVRDSSTRKVTFYVDGKQLGTVQSYYYNPEGGGSGPLFIGSETESNNSSAVYPFDGQIDEVRIWNVAKSLSDIRETMMKTLTGLETGLAAYYRFDQSQGTTLYDMTGSGNNGTQKNMAGTEWTVSQAFNTWLGVESSDWSSTVNWSDGVPTSTDNVGIYKTDLGKEATISSSPTIDNLIISSTASPTLNTGMTVNGNLILENDLSLNGQTIALGSSGYLIEEGGYLTGSSGEITTTRNLANINEDVGGMGATIATTANMGTTVISRGHTSYSKDSDNSINRYFKILPTNNSGLNGTLTFSYREEELNGNTESGLELFKSNDNGSTWQNQNGNVNTSSNSLSLSGISSLAMWTLIEDTHSPTAEVTYSPSGPYHTGDVVTLTATFSEEMKDTPVPQISISGVNTLAAANMVKTSNTVYTYDYTIQAGPGNCNVSLSTGTDLAGNVVQSAPTSGTTFTITNQNPTFTSTPVTSVNDNESYEYTITADDGDGDAVSISDGTVPSWLALADFAEVSTLGPADLSSTDIRGCAADALGNVYVALMNHHKILKITADGVVSTFAGNGNRGNVDATGIDAEFDYPFGVAIGPKGNIFVSESIGQKIRKITPSGEVTTLAGSSQGYLDGTGTAARFYYPRGIAVDASGNVYVADQNNNRIRRVTPDGVVTTLAGSGPSGSGLDGYEDGPATTAKFDWPNGITVDPTGNVFVADTYNDKIRKITPEGVVTTFASGFSRPHGIASDEAGNLYVADTGNRRIKKITPDGTVSIFAGSGSYSNTDGSAETASFKSPYDVSVNGNGNVYVANTANIRKIESGTKLRGSAVGHAGEYPVSLKATDTNGGETSQNFTITVNDVTPPSGYSVSIDQNYINSSNESSASFTFASAEVGSTYNYTISSDGGGTPVSNSGTIASATDNVSSINLSGLADGTLTLSVTLTDVAGNTGLEVSDSNEKDATIPTVLCQNYTLELDENGAGSINVDQIDGGSSDTNGIKSKSLSVTSFDCSDVGEVSVELTVVDHFDNVATCSSKVTVEDNIKPIVSAKNAIIYLDESGEASITPGQINNGSEDNCGLQTISLSKSRFSCADVGVNEVTLTVTDVNDNVNTAPAEITVIDEIKPTAVAQDMTLFLDQEGYAVTTAEAVDGGSTDNCGIASISLSKTEFACEDLGANQVILTVVDNNNNQSTVEATVTVKDDTAPTVVSKNMTVALDENGMASVTPSQLDGGSTDNCSIAIKSLSQMDFSCEHVGDNVVTLTVTDQSNNSESVAAVVAVVDDIAPVAICKNRTVELDENGMATIDPSAIDGGSYDNCSFTLSANKTSFTCDDIGEQKVLLTATDASGNSSSCEAFVTIVDKTPPVAVCQDIAVSLGGKGNIAVMASRLNNGSYDACSEISLSISGEEYIVLDCEDMGENLIPLTVTDVYGNSSTCNARVTVTDDMRPVAACKSITAYLNETGNVIISASDVDNESYDNCAIESLALNKTHFTCDEIGENEVIMTVVDNSGNYDYCMAIVNVVDTISPMIDQLDDITVVAEPDACYAAVEFNSPFAEDACGISVEQVAGLENGSDFPVGTTKVTFVATDNSGNTSESSFNVYVEGINKAPTLDEIADVVAQAYQTTIDIPLQGIIAGDDCTGDQVSEITALASNSAIVTGAVVSYITGDETAVLSLSLVGGVSGSSEVIVTAKDNGGTSNGGIDEASQSFNITILENHSPQVDKAIDGIVVDNNTTSTETLPAEIFSDSDEGDMLTYSLTLEDETTLPSWISFNEETMEITFSPTDNELGEYKLILTATDRLGAAANAEVVVDVQVSTGLADELDYDFDLDVYPNPTKGTVYIDIKSKDYSEAEIHIRNLVGQEVYSKKHQLSGPVMVDLSNQIDGMYLVLIEIGDYQLTRKFVLRH